MSNTTTIHSRAAIGGGLVAAGASTVLLARDALHTGPTVDHLMMPVLVGLTVLAAHLGWQAAREWRVVALPLLVLAAFGSGLIVFETMGRRAESRDTRVADATARNQARADKIGDLERARRRLADAERQVDHETRNGGCPDRRRDGRRSVCSDWKQRAEEVRSHIAALEAEVGKLGGAAPVDAKAARVAAVLVMVGVPLPAEAIEARVAVLDPFALPLFLEGLAIFLFGCGIGHTRPANGQDTPATGDSRQTSFPAAGGDPEGSGGPPRGNGPKPGKRAPSPARQSLPANVVSLAGKRSAPPASQTGDVDAVLTALASVGGTVASNRELASLMGVTPGEATKRRRAAAGMLTYQRAGKEVRIALTAPGRAKVG